MARRWRQKHSTAFKAKVAVAAIKGEKTLIEFAQEFDVYLNCIKQWRDQLLEGPTQGLMHRIDWPYTEILFAGSPMLQGLLVQEGGKIGRLRAAKLMKCIAIETLYRNPNISNRRQMRMAGQRHRAPHA